jgi:outer membrane biogenesis lipoprotein LolB
MKTRLILLLTIAASTLLVGCTTRTSRDTSIPWSRPANWEGQIPGLSQPGN